MWCWYGVYTEMKMAIMGGIHSKRFTRHVFSDIKKNSQAWFYPPQRHSTYMGDEDRLRTPPPTTRDILCGEQTAHKGAEKCYKRDLVEEDLVEIGHFLQRCSSLSSHRCLQSGTPSRPKLRCTGSLWPHTGTTPLHVHTGNLSRKSSWLNRNPMSVKVRWKNPVGRRTITKCRFPGKDACKETETTCKRGTWWVQQRLSNALKRGEITQISEVFFWLAWQSFLIFKTEGRHYKWFRDMGCNCRRIVHPHLPLEQAGVQPCTLEGHLLETLILYVMFCIINWEVNLRLSREQRPGTSRGMTDRLGKQNWLPNSLIIL